MPFFEGAHNFTVSGVEYNSVEGSQVNIYDTSTESRSTYTTPSQSPNRPLDHLPRTNAFFNGATDFSVQGGEFNVVRGCQTNIRLNRSTLNGHYSQHPTVNFFPTTGTRQDYRAHADSRRVHATANRVANTGGHHHYLNDPVHDVSHASSLINRGYSAARTARPLVTGSLEEQSFGRQMISDGNHSRNPFIDNRDSSSVNGRERPTNSFDHRFSNASSATNVHVSASGDARVEPVFGYASGERRAGTSPTISMLSHYPTNDGNATYIVSGASGSTISGGTINIVVGEVVSGSAGELVAEEHERGSDIDSNSDWDEMEDPPPSYEEHQTPL